MNLTTPRERVRRECARVIHVELHLLTDEERTATVGDLLRLVLAIVPGDCCLADRIDMAIDLLDGDDFHSLVDALVAADVPDGRVTELLIGQGLR